MQNYSAELDAVLRALAIPLGGWLLSPLVGASTINQGNFSIAGLLVSLGGAIALLAIVRLVAGKRVR